MKITEIVFYNTNRAKLVVEIPETDAYTTMEVPRIPRILFKLFPHMATQRCYNDGGYSFRREAQATEIPHLFEHLIIEIQDQVRRGIGAPFAGETQWNWTIDPRGRFYVTVDYDNEIVALGAIRLAERVINALDSKDIAQVDTDKEIVRLRELAKISRRFAPSANGREMHRFEPEPEPDEEIQPEPEPVAIVEPEPAPKPRRKRSVVLPEPVESTG
ncbi:MAG: cyanophycin synthetase family protein [Capsulimonadaceae bacterium]